MNIWTSLLLTQGHVADPKLAASLMSESSEKETQSARDFAGETHIEGREPSMTRVRAALRPSSAAAGRRRTKQPKCSPGSATYRGRLVWASFR